MAAISPSYVYLKIDSFSRCSKYGMRAFSRLQNTESELSLSFETQNVNTFWAIDHGKRKIWLIWRQFFEDIKKNQKLGKSTFSGLQNPETEHFLGFVM